MIIMADVQVAEMQQRIHFSSFFLHDLFASVQSFHMLVVDKIPLMYFKLVQQHLFSTAEGLFLKQSILMG